jgi:putative DNA primase/helicase
VNGASLLNELESLLIRFVILPDFAAETLALWVLHTYAFELRDVSTYVGVESPEKRCGKTTLLSILSRLANRPVAAANISPSASFRVIEEMRPTLLIDEADTFLRGNDELRGILNAGYTRDTAYVVRVTQADLNQVGTRSTAFPYPAEVTDAESGFDVFPSTLHSTLLHSSNRISPKHLGR